MSIYTTKHNYRKIYENEYGPIPRGYEIHHIDGNHNNNDISNLKAVTIQEHYDIHYAQKDWHACMLIAYRLGRDPDYLKVLANKRIKDGTHNFLGGEIQRKTSRRRVKDGTHDFLGGEIQRKTSRRRVKDGTHNFLGGEIQRKTSREARMKEVNEGTHHFITNHPSKTKVTCPHCGKVGDKPNMMRYHFNKCKTFLNNM